MSAGDSTWSPTNGNEQTYAYSGSNSFESDLGIKLEYRPPPESDQDPLLPVPENEQERDGRF